MKLVYKLSALMRTPGRVTLSHVNRTFEDVLEFNAFRREIEACGDCAEYSHSLALTPESGK